MIFTINSVNDGKSEKKNMGRASVWKEVVLSFIVSIPFFTHGLETTTLTSSAHTGHFITSDGVPWSTTAMVIGAGVAAPLFCCVIDRHGRKVGLFGVSMVQGASLIPLFLPSNVSMLVLHTLAGLSSGGLFTVLPIYIREITASHGFSISLMMVMTTAGYMMKLVMNLEVRMYVMLGLVGVQFLSILVMIESPSYLVMVKKFGAARTVLSKLKRLPEDSGTVSKEISNLQDESDRATSHGKLSVRTIWRNKIWLDATKMGLLLYTVTALSGSILFLDQQKTLVQLKINADPESTLVLYSLLAGSLFCLVFILFVDRKYLLTLGYLTMTIATGVIAVYTQVDLTVTSPKWVPIAALAILVAGYGLSWGLPIMILVEILNFEIRATLLGAIYAYSQVIKMLHIHTFQYIEDYMGIYTVFYIFAGINLYGMVYTLFEVPNIRNKTVRQIERQLKRPALPA